MIRAGLLALVSLAITGCVAKAVVSAATAPVRVASKAVDLTTTSREEADRNAGRKQRKAEKQCRKHPETCRVEQRLVPDND